MQVSEVAITALINTLISEIEFWKKCYDAEFTTPTNDMVDWIVKQVKTINDEENGEKSNENHKRN